MGGGGGGEGEGRLHSLKKFASLIMKEGINFTPTDRSNSTRVLMGFD